ncbi:hypothetical protein [uncultured Prevotella sp.]|uniref:hypothetical protein n=1 Tax=uncultured Prevotella sp. TaxID=159272 RepID=UPI0026296DB8|nr:hypothetical protein [uncultured Prevotella sp.]
MNERKIKDIERLIGKFFDGETSLKEEQRLYEFFARRDVPQRLAGYREVFAGFASLQAVEPKRQKLRPILMRVAAAAAVVLIVVSAVLAYADYREDRYLARLYGGSYVIENGQRIDDLSEIKGDIEKALDDAGRIERRISSASVTENAEQEVLNSIDDPAERRRISEMLND